MGQGTESCGGYEVEYDPHGYDESNGYTVWAGNKGDYKVSSMKKSHIKNCIRLCESKSLSESFSCDSEKWQDWVEVFKAELLNRDKSTPITRAADSKATQKPRGQKKSMRCHCGQVYDARVADLKRGWALSCSKSCAAIRKKYKKPKAKELSK